MPMMAANSGRKNRYQEREISNFGDRLACIPFFASRFLTLSVNPQRRDGSHTFFFEGWRNEVNFIALCSRPPPRCEGFAMSENAKHLGCWRGDSLSRRFAGTMRSDLS